MKHSTSFKKVLAKRTVLLCAYFVLCVMAFGQKQKNELWARVEYNIHLRHVFNKTSGPGLNVKGVRAFSRHMDGSVSVGYNYLKGKVEYWNGTPDDHFALAPLLAGVRYRYNKVFLGFEAGTVIKASYNAATLFALAPSVGYCATKFSSELRLLHMPGMPSFPENSFLKKGGYSFLGIRLSYRLY